MLYFINYSSIFLTSLLTEDRRMSKIITSCPSCQRADVFVTKIDCEGCGTKFEGKFDIPSLLKLSDEDLDFIVNFVKCSGSLKEMAKIRHVSYPTLRNQLNALIELLEMLEQSAETSKADVLNMIEEGKISAKEAVVMLKRIG